MMAAIFATLLGAFVSSWLGRGRLAAVLFVSTFALAVGLFAMRRRRVPYVRLQAAGLARRLGTTDSSAGPMWSAATDSAARRAR